MTVHSRLMGFIVVVMASWSQITSAAPLVNTAKDLNCLVYQDRGRCNAIRDAVLGCYERNAKGLEACHQQHPPASKDKGRSEPPDRRDALDRCVQPHLADWNSCQKKMRELLSEMKKH